MTDTTPLTSQQLDEIEGRAKIRRTALSGWINCYSPLSEQEALENAEAVLEEDVPALLATVRRLQTELAREERLHGDTIDERDRATDAADRLAYAVASETVIGEHTADNSPWANALELITPAADVDKLRAELAEYEALNPQQCPAGKHPDWLVDSEYAHACPWCRIAELERPAAVRSV